MKIEDLEVTLKTFDKDDLLVIFVPEDTEMCVCDTLHQYIENLKISISVLILPKIFDIKKINFIGIEDKKVDKVEIKDDVVCIKFVEK